VRECPVKAIKINNGQAEVINERCIGCGNCVKVCSQSAKYPLSSIRETNQLLSSGGNIAAILAPSFPAEFTDIPDHSVLAGMIRRLGFSYVAEVSFGADIVARKYEERIRTSVNGGDISSDCPAIVYFIRQYHPELVNSLAPIVSPMVAMTRVMRKRYGEELKIIFIGPCFTKKAESDEVDEALTFPELRKMFAAAGITPEETPPSGFDPPHSGRGAIFPISRGLYYTSNNQEIIPEERVVIAEGRVNFKEAVKEFEDGLIRSKHLQLLCCEGCIMGPGTSSNGKRFARSAAVGEYVSRKLNTLDKQQWERDMEEYGQVDLGRSFHPEDRRYDIPANNEIEDVLHAMGKFEAKDHLNCGACGYDTCVEHAIAIIKGLAETEMCLPFTIEKLHDSIENLNVSNEKLANARAALRQSEKLAHMGQISAGIAHELNNPLGVITMYSNILLDESAENDPMRADLSLIIEQAGRCKKIVSGLLNFARKNQVTLKETDVVKFARHSLDSVIRPENVGVRFTSSVKDPVVSLDIDQMMQALVNLEKNAVEAMPAGGELSVDVKDTPQDVTFIISDTGVGIPKEHMDKLFTPFFTTKENGRGTGLGLALIYGIVKMHKGKIDVVSNDNPRKGQTGTSFRIMLPRNKESN
jgi:iron only hydrogenase large subunit-like protein/nitrogen-specific signal transduction histidine kinase